MSNTVECTCANKQCKKIFTARVADRKRGWGKFCSKSCKAKKQTAKQFQQRRSGKIVHRKAWLEAKAERNPEALTSCELEELGASQWEINAKLHDEAMDDCTSSHGQDEGD